jgi:hypothetical protein
MKVEHQNRRRNGENAVAQRCDAADLAAGQSVVVGLHGATIAFGPKRVNPARARKRLEARRGSAPFDFRGAFIRGL